MTREEAVARRGVAPRPRRLLATPLHQMLAPLVVLAAGLGVALPDAARTLRPGVPAMLAGQVAGVALTITARQLSPVLRQFRRLLIALGVQWTVIPLVGVGLYHWAGGNPVGQGALITAAAPAEITSALVAVVAGADAATAAALMTASVALGCVLTPLWLLALGHAGVSPGELVPELVLSVALPLAAGVTVRSRYAGVGAYPSRFLDLSGISLLLVVFVGAGYARPLFTSARIGQAIAFAAVLVVSGAAVGTATGVRAARSTPIRLAVAYPIAMREFGIATAVALLVAPRAAGFGGLYGLMMMFIAAGTASVIRRRRRAPVITL
jgi:predicted Na+-dependent transporter